jgi:hypothetical protein
MEKKTYAKPELKVLRIELGVFGDYADGSGNGRGDRDGPIPIDVIRHLDLHME